MSLIAHASPPPTPTHHRTSDDASSWATGPFIGTLPERSLPRHSKTRARRISYGGHSSTTLRNPSEAILALAL